MKIEQLEIVNFRAFHGKYTLDFATDPEKNVTLLVGNNRAGKSKILEAIHWCLYDSLPDDSTDIDNKINDQSEEIDPAANATVRLILSNIENGKEKRYLLSRILPSEGARSTFSAEIEDKTRQNPWQKMREEPEFLAERMLPSALKNFFLFRGEAIQKMFSANSESHLKSAIRKIQGLNYMESSVKDLEDYYTSLLTQLEKESKQIEVKSKDSRTLTQLKELRDNLIEDRNNKVADRKESEGREKKYDELIDDSKDKRIKTLNKRNIEILETIKYKLKPKTKELEDGNEKLVENFGARVFGFSYKKELDQLTSDLIKKKKYPAEYSEAFAKSLKEAGVCVCGESLNDEKIKVLESNLSGGYTQKQAYRRDEIVAEVGTYEIANQNHLKELSRNNNQLLEIQNEIKKLDDEYKKNEDELDSYKGEDATKIAEYRKFREKEREEQKSLNMEIGKLDLKINEAKSSYDLKKRESEKRAANNIDPNLQNKIIVIKRAIRRLQEQINDYSDRGREGILSKLNELVKKASSSGEAFIYSAEDSYTPLLVQPGSTQERPGMNTGDIAMKSIYFACASILQVRTIAEDDENLTEGTVAPLVCDAPFSNLDPSNLPNASKMLINSGEQVIVLVNYKDYISGFKKVLNDSGRMGKCYCIQNKIKTKEIGSDVILDMDIEGQTFKSTITGQKVETSFVTEVKIDG